MAEQTRALDDHHVFAHAAPRERSPRTTGFARWKSQNRSRIRQSRRTAEVTPRCPGSAAWASTVRRLPHAWPGRRSHRPVQCQTSPSAPSSTGTAPSPAHQRLRVRGGPYPWVRKEPHPPSDSSPRLGRHEPPYRRPAGPRRSVRRVAPTGSLYPRSRLSGSPARAGAGRGQTAPHAGLQSWTISPTIAASRHRRGGAPRRQGSPAATRRPRGPKRHRVRGDIHQPRAIGRCASGSSSPRQQTTLGCLRDAAGQHRHSNAGRETAADHVAIRGPPHLLSRPSSRSTRANVEQR